MIQNRKQKNVIDNFDSIIDLNRRTIRPPILIHSLTYTKLMHVVETPNICC